MIRFFWWYQIEDLKGKLAKTEENCQRVLTRIGIGTGESGPGAGVSAASTRAADSSVSVQCVFLAHRNSSHTHGSAALAPAEYHRSGTRQASSSLPQRPGSAPARVRFPPINGALRIVSLVQPDLVWPDLVYPVTVYRPGYLMPTPHSTDGR